jgi:hypothetical protein
MGEELQINIPKRAAVVFYKKTIDIIQKIKYTVQRRVKGNISVCRKGGGVQRAYKWMARLKLGQDQD